MAIDPTNAPWADALLAATLIAIDPPGLGGACVHARPGPARDMWIEFFRGILPADEPMRRLPLHISEDRLLGGLDLVEALQHGKASYRAGALAETNGGFVLLPSAERVPARLRSHLSSVLDTGEVVLQRDGIARRITTRIGVIALDESLDDDEPTPPQLLDRLAFLFDLSALKAPPGGLSGARDAAAIPRARGQLRHVVVDEATTTSLCDVAAKLGIGSVRVAMMAVRAARAIAALSGRSETTADDAKLAARLVLAPRATQLPAADPPDPPDAPADQEDPPEAPTPPQNDLLSPDDRPEPEDTRTDDPEPTADDMILAAAIASIPAHLLDRIASGTQRSARGDMQGRSGASRQAMSRGRPAGTRRGKPGAGVRLNIIETLLAAAPWQRARRTEDDLDVRRMRIRSSDLRITRYKQRMQTTTVFIVDASGSAALNRLAEAKGAVELLLAECYVRRDQVCVIAFRGRTAEMMLPPTRSLVRAKRNLGGLAGGGGTPLASAIQAGIFAAEQGRRAGQTVTLVMLSDGCANIALDGNPGRERAEADALASARRVSAESIPTIFIDISNRGQKQARDLSSAMNARYLWLPYADASRISDAVKSASARSS